ncbi:hypothetical protein TTHERM_00463070 (macronuclear) [Tetrahymena thermophila SB210]|uniref:Uncharacterized protein n=1 Tax=Tetrahymena thermophila (strain SB210) TaxID=312017 RepID=Q23PX6_TETTS|nr:hypothetical protein TTHERM_00463070 [Tetrahymena thermophila SB210]EAR98559.2 hypothetical protein TTHERM_00463070 [Tetrahymena thermophila SB210]|eukprot:XP_001018804.2 hypothetical protein TTHERM_00463070 [Tetrahymena thermophila SB210]
MLASQNTLEGFQLLSPVTKIKKIRAQFDILMHDTLIQIKKKKYKKAYYSLERFLTVSSIDLLEAKDKLKLNFRIFYVLDKVIQNKLTQKDVQKLQSIKEIDSINQRMIEGFMFYNDIYQSVLREEQLRNTLESNKQLIVLINHEDAISKLFCMIIQLYINNYFLENLKNQVFLGFKYLLQAKEMIQLIYTLNNSHLLEKDIYITILLGNFYSEHGQYKKALDIFQDGIKSVIMFLRYKYIDPNPSLDNDEDEEDEKSIQKQRKFQRSIKLIISFLYSLAYLYERMWKIEYSYETLQLARFLGKHVLFDNTDEFKRYLIHVEHELDTKYTKIVQETLEIESIVCKELLKNKKWYQISEIMKEKKEQIRLNQNMYDEELYFKNNVKKLNQQKVFPVKKCDDNSFRTFYSSISKKKQSQETSSLSRNIENSSQKGLSFDKRERAITLLPTQINNYELDSSRLLSYDNKLKAETQDEMQFNKMKEISHDLNGAQNEQKLKQNKRSFSQQNPFNYSIINSKNTQLINAHKNYTNSNNGQNNLQRINGQNKQKSEIGQNSNTLNNLNHIEYNNEEELVQTTGSNDISIQENQKIIDIRKIEVRGKNNNEILEKTPSNKKQQRSRRSLTHNSSNNLEKNIIQDQSVSNNYIDGSSTKNTNYINSNEKSYQISSKTGIKDFTNSLSTATKAQNKFQERNKSASLGRFSTPQSRIKSNSKSTYHINYGRMSIRIQDVTNHENFGALSNLLLNDKLEKLEEDSNTQEANSSQLFESPSSSSSTLSPTSKSGAGVAASQGLAESKSFKQKTFKTTSSVEGPLAQSTFSSSDKQHFRNNNSNQRYSYSDNKSNQLSSNSQSNNNQQMVYGQNTDMTNFDYTNFGKQKKDFTNLDYYLSQNIYKALQKSFVSKSYTKIKKDVTEWKRKDDLQRKNLLFGKKMLKFKMKEDLIRPMLRKLDSSTMKNISSFRQTVYLDAQQDGVILDVQEKIDHRKQDIQEIKNQLKQKMNETKDSQSQISDYEEEQNNSLFYDSHNKKETLRDIILKHRSIFPLIRVRKLLKDRKKMMLKKQQQEILKNRYRQSITGNSNSTLLQFVSQRKTDNMSENESPQLNRVRFAQQYSNITEDTIKGDDEKQDNQADLNNKDSQKYYLRNKELLHNMIENYETEKEREIRGENQQRYRFFSSDTAMLQNRRSVNSIAGGPPKQKQLAFYSNNKDLALSTSLLHAMKSNAMECQTFLSVVNLQKLAKTRQTIKEKLTKVQED